MAFFFLALVTLVGTGVHVSWINSEVSSAFFEDEGRYKTEQTVFDETLNNTAFLDVKFVEINECRQIFSGISIEFACDEAQTANCAATYAQTVEPENACSGIRRAFDLSRVASFVPYEDGEKNIKGEYKIKSTEAPVILDWTRNSRAAEASRRIYSEGLLSVALSAVFCGLCAWSGCSCEQDVDERRASRALAHDPSFELSERSGTLPSGTSGYSDFTQGSIPSGLSKGGDSTSLRAAQS